ncbi:MAG TPA: M1 family metallopeptidase, partial [Anaerolineae bacterium]
MASRLTRLSVVLFLLTTSCNPAATVTSSPTPTPPVDDLAIYKPALVAGSQNDLAQLDRPTRYGLSLSYDPATQVLSGGEDALYVNRQSIPLNEIYFRLFANYPDSGGGITVSNLTVDSAPQAFTLEVQGTALRVPLAHPLAPNSAVNLHLDFRVKIGRNSKGHYADFTANDSITTMPSVYPLIPAYDAKGWHIELPPPYGDLVYADVSLYAVTMTVPTTLTVIASGSTVGTTDNGNGTKTWRLVGAPMRDFDLNVTAQLTAATSLLGETTVNSWYEAVDADAGKKALKFATDALRIYQNRFGTYPYRELDVVETPTTAGGIEYPGIVVLARNLYHDPREADYFEFAAVHEVAHQWWYGMVGDDQVNQPWVDESLAQYSSLIDFEDLRGASSRPTIVRQIFQDPYNRAKSA